MINNNKQYNSNHNNRYPRNRYPRKNKTINIDIAMLVFVRSDSLYRVSCYCVGSYRVSSYE